jgi:hypothetical protein
MERFEKMFSTKVSYAIGLPVTYHYFGTSDLSYFHRIDIIDDNRVSIKFEKSSIQTYFDTKKERDEFIKFFKLKVKEANTFGKNKH